MSVGNYNIATVNPNIVQNAVVNPIAIGQNNAQYVIPATWGDYSSIVGGGIHFNRLDLSNRKLTGLDRLNLHDINILNISNCQLTSLDGLDMSEARINTFDCSKNPLTSLPTLPNTITILYICDTLITSLPNIPTKLKELRCDADFLLKWGHNLDWSGKQYVIYTRDRGINNTKEFIFMQMIQEMTGITCIEDAFTEYHKWLYRVGGEKYNEAKNELT